MKIIEKLIDYVTFTIGIVSSIITIGVSFGDGKNSWIVGLCGFFLLGCIVVIAWKYLTARNRLYALRLLSKRGRANTVNFLALLDYLENDYDVKHDNETKTTVLKVRNSKYTFHYYNQDSTKNIDIDYKHFFEVTGGISHFDALIMHSNGELIRESDIGDESGVYVDYLHRKIDLRPRPVLGDINNSPNQHFDRVHWPLGAKKVKKEWLIFHYRNKGGANLEEDDVFVIYPRNYGKRFTGNAVFDISYEKPYKAQITLYKLPYNVIREPKLILVSGFTHSDDYSTYHCDIPSIDIHSIYFIMMERI